MSNLTHSFEVQFEFEDGSTNVHMTSSLAFKGIRNDSGSRPVYITVTCMSPQSDYIVTDYEVEDISKLRCVLAKCDSPCYLVVIKPYWFYKKIIHAGSVL